VIERANEEISARLRRSLLDPFEHEAAALVIAAFALREAAGSYSDLRAVLCRLTAHLAFAEALREGVTPSLAGRVATAALLVLGGRGADADHALAALERERTGVAQKVWTRALRLRLEDDTRGFAEEGSLLERRELYRAELLTGGRDQSARRAHALGLFKGTEAWRLAAEAGLSVENGNALLSDALEQELREAQSVYALARPGGASEAELLTALNEPSERLITPAGPRVIGWGTWAAFFQRHIIHCLWQRDHHRRSMLGLPEDANRERKTNGLRFGRLRLAPLLEVRQDLDARERPRRLDELVRLAVREPELLMAGHWYAVEEVARYEMVRHGMPEARRWFKPTPPRGTTFDALYRYQVHLLPRDVPALETLSRISPSDFFVTRALLYARHGEKAPLKEVERAFARRVDYDLRVLEGLVASAEKDPEALLRQRSRLCDAAPDHCFAYGAVLVREGRDDAAAAAYKRGMRSAHDRVSASINAPWLVEYYLARRRNSDAKELAEEAAEVGSFSGLITLARYLETTGDFEGAEALIRNARERYGDKPLSPDEKAERQDGIQDEDTLLAFYYRLAFVNRRPGYEARFWELARDDFPAGLEKLDRDTLAGRPTDGVSVLTTTAWAERCGLRAGDIIVGLDGFRVRTRRQYLLVLAFARDAEVNLVVFRHPGYLDVRGRSPNRHLGMEMRSQKASGSAAGA
jgi:hypothetical protein